MVGGGLLVDFGALRLAAAPDVPSGLMPPRSSQQRSSVTSQRWQPSFRTVPPRAQACSCKLRGGFRVTVRPSEESSSSCGSTWAKEPID